jgi:excisionase family DNA binding protein
VRRETQRPKRSSEATEIGPSLLDELMTVQEVAAIFGLRVSTVEEYARRGLLPDVKVGRHRRFLRYQVEEALRGLIEAQSNRTGWASDPNAPNR